MAHHIFVSQAPHIPPPPCFIDVLAQELVDRIIDFCHASDPARIGAYGLVCKCWLPRSRYYLFAKVSLNADNMPEYIRIVDESLLPLLSFTQHLHLFTGRSPLDEWLLHRLHPSTNLVSVALTVDVFHNVRSSARGRGIVDQIKYLESLSTHLRRLAAAPIRNLSVKLVLTTEISLSTLLRLFACVPSVQTLCITTGNEFTPPSLTDTAPLLLHLRKLSIDAPECGEAIFSWLNTVPTTPTLPALSVRGWLEEDDALMSMKAFFSRVGARLETLELGITALTWEVVRAHYQVILSNATPTLKKLTLKCVHPVQVLDVFPCLPPLEKIALDVIVTARGAPEHWARIDAVLAEPQYRTAIKPFKVRRVFGTELGTSARMPLAGARGILG